MVIANGYSTSHFDHMYTWAPDWACSDIIEYESATECDLSDSTVAYATDCDLSDLSDTDYILYDKVRFNM